MNALAKLAESLSLAPDSLEDRLAWLEQFGRPRIGKFDSGWHATVEMTVRVTGAEYKIASEFGHPTPASAAAQCIERVKAAMQS